MDRRRVLLAGAAGGAAILLRGAPVFAGKARQAPPLDPITIPKYVTELPVSPPMPVSGQRGGIDEYRIAARQFAQQVLPSGMPRTTVWGYGSSSHSGTFRSPARSIEAKVGRPVRVTWANQLVDKHGRYLPHLLPVDPTLHWANPPGGIRGRDSTPTFTSTPGPYTGPVPLVTHLHGGLSPEESDGYTDAWYLPHASDIPAKYARVGSWYDRYRALFARKYGVRWQPGSATYQYPNEQPAAFLWFHDHALGLTRLNAYAGLAGGYLLRGGPTDLPPGTLPATTGRLDGRPGPGRYEIPLVIEDRSFLADGSLFYPASRAYFDGYPGPYIPYTDVPPIWNPEFFADTIVVNGATWPVLPVEQRRYRLRLLNACNSRSLILSVAADPTARPAQPVLPLWQIGTRNSMLPDPVRVEKLVMGNAYRADVIVDFTDVPQGTALYLVNEAPDGPLADYEDPGEPADPQTTGQVLKFVVGPRTGVDRSAPPETLDLPALAALSPAVRTRKLALLEQELTDVGPVKVLLGVIDANGRAVPMQWDDPVTETPTVGRNEIWEFHNSTADAHPIHLHDTQFRLIGRGPDGTVPPAPQELGLIDTILAYPNEITRILVRFANPGRYVWHCHILEHEDNEMMRPLQVLPKGTPPTGDGSTATGHGNGFGLGVAGAATVAAAGTAALVLRRLADLRS
ncbi:multicopper oxidase family protein [Micromonospora humi]|uniref:Bilirubin oxidase n=1 Tax=Micromonospora humi TaxID=745366 RepID=A0A1C5JPP3_9ACTN|nr:multicopper oxidase [Micromonospora humi]SCG72453.1 bilirubin oxidase [Micromonospora humi]